jgi:hypothetical protein
MEHGVTNKRKQTDSETIQRDRFANRPPWWGNFDYPPPSGVLPHHRGTSRPPTNVPPPSLIDDPAGDGGPPASTAETWDGYMRPRNAARDIARKNRPREQLPPRSQEEIEKIRDREYIRRRREEWRMAGEELKNSEIPRCVLLPIENESNLGEDPDESDDERRDRLRRAEWIRRGAVVERLRAVFL